MLPFFQQLEQADQDVTLAINQLSSPFTDGLWAFFSDKLVWIPLYVLIAILLFVKLGWKKALIALLAAGLTIAVADQFSGLVKDWADRLRPCWDERMTSRGLNVLEGRGGKYGFFSSHASNAIGLALCTLGCLRMAGKPIFLRIYGSVMVIWAFMVGISRIFVGKHFLGDVIVGLAAGALIGWLISRLARLAASKAGL